MIQRGDCLSCKKIGSCLATDEEKIYQGYTCQLFEAILEPEYLARLDMMKKYGDAQAIRAFLNRPVHTGEEDD